MKAKLAEDKSRRQDGAQTGFTSTCTNVKVSAKVKSTERSFPDQMWLDTKAETVVWSAL